MGLFGFGKKKNMTTGEISDSTFMNISKEDVAEVKEKVSLAKEEVHKVCLTKKPLVGLKARVGLVLDFSGSMISLYNDGTVQDVIEKILPIAMEFDDNGSMETWIFDDGFHRLPDITLGNCTEYVKREIMDAGYEMGGTRYAPVMKDVISLYGKDSSLPSYVIFITDGDNFGDDRQKTTKLISDASKRPIFWQFVGVGHSDFGYLQGLDDLEGRYVDNADFFKVDRAENITYKDLLNEFPEWLEYPEVKKMLNR